MDALSAAFASTPRQGFLPPAMRRFAGCERPLGIGHKQTNSQPRTIRDMLALLDVRPGHRVLDVGCGSGWTTALLAHLVGPDGWVIGVEIVPELRRWGAQNLARCGLDRARIEQASPDRLGQPGEAPYDRILVSANASQLPTDLVAQLAPHGTMVVPVAGRMAKVTTPGESGGGSSPAVEVSWHGHYLFVPLIEPGARP